VEQIKFLLEDKFQTAGKSHGSSGQLLFIEKRAKLKFGRASSEFTSIVFGITIRPTRSHRRA
jgi:hypothetical protein